MTVTFTAQEYAELKALAARISDLALFYAPTYAQRDVQAAWADLCSILGTAQETALTAAREGQLGLFSVEGWPV